MLLVFLLVQAREWRKLKAVGTAEDEGNCDDFEVGVEVKKSTGVGVSVVCFSSVLDWVLSSFHKEECDCKSY
jgi:hypothetical protein